MGSFIILQPDNFCNYSVISISYFYVKILSQTHVVDCQEGGDSDQENYRFLRTYTRPQKHGRVSQIVLPKGSKGLVSLQKQSIPSSSGCMPSLRKIHFAGKYYSSLFIAIFMSLSPTTSPFALKTSKFIFLYCSSFLMFNLKTSVV